MLQLIEISLICTGIHVCFMQGMIFGWLGEKMEHWLFKPLAMCLPCMASFWTIVIEFDINIPHILIVCGMNTIIASLLQFFDNTKLPENE